MSAYTLQHVQEQHYPLIFREIHRLLTPEGHAVIDCGNFLNIRQRVQTLKEKGLIPEELPIREAPSKDNVAHVHKYFFH